MNIFNELYKTLPNLQSFILRTKAVKYDIEFKYNFDSRLIKEILRERLIIQSSKWDYRTVRNYCSILGEGNLKRTDLCKHLSSALINNFEKVLLFMLNDMTSFRDYTQFGLREIWMPRFLLRMLQLAMCPKLEPHVRISDLIYIRYNTPDEVEFYSYEYELPKSVVGYVPDYAKQHIKRTKDGEPVVKRCPEESEYIEALIQLTLLSKTAFRDCSIEVGSYGDMIEYNDVDFMTMLTNSEINLFNENTYLITNASLTRENLLTNLVLGMYCSNLKDIDSNIFNAISVPLDNVQIREELRLYIESEFRTSVAFTPEKSGEKKSESQSMPKSDNTPLVETIPVIEENVVEKKQVKGTKAKKGKRYRKTS